MNRAILNIMLHSCESKLAKLQLVLEEEERRINNDIAASHTAGQRLGEHYWQEAHTIRQKIASAEFLRGILLQTLEETKHASRNE